MSLDEQIAALRDSTQGKADKCARLASQADLIDDPALAAMLRRLGEVSQAEVVIIDEYLTREEA